MRISDWSSDVCSSDLDVEQAHARGTAADNTQAVEPHADELCLVGDEHQLMRPRRRETGDDRAVAADIVDVGDALATAAGPAIFISRRQLAIAIGGDGEEELLAPRHQNGRAHFCTRVTNPLLVCRLMLAKKNTRTIS